MTSDNLLKAATTAIGWLVALSLPLLALTGNIAIFLAALFMPSISRDPKIRFDPLQD